MWMGVTLVTCASCIPGKEDEVDVVLVIEALNYLPVATRQHISLICMHAMYFFVMSPCLCDVIVHV